MYPNCKFSKVCVKAILVLSFALLTFIFVKSLSRISVYANRFIDIVHNKTLVLILFSLALMFIIFAIFKLINKCNNKALRLIVIISFAIILIVQILIIIKFNIHFTTDAFIINDHSLALADGTVKTIDTSDEYFKYISNNNFLVLLLTPVYKAFLFFGITSYTRCMFLINAILIDASIFMVYRIIKLCSNNNVATKFIVLSLLNPITYFLILWVYSAVYSMPLVVGVVYLAISVWKSTRGFCARNCVKIGAIALLAVVGYYLRPIVLIPVMAIIICAILLIKVSKKNFKHLAIYLAVFVLVGASSFGALNKAVYSFVPDTSEYFPITHYIMLGLSYDGKFNEKHVEYTSKFKTKSEKQAANIKMIKKLIKKRGPVGVAKLYLNKTSETWGEGSNAYTAFARFVHDEVKVHSWIFGERSDFILVYCQLFRILSLLFAAILVLFSIFNKKVDESFIVSLTILGGIIFYMIWEAKEAYSVPFVPLLVMMACLGIEKTMNYDKAKKVINKKVVLVSSLCVIEVATLITGIVFCNGFTKKEFANTDISLFSFKNSTQQIIEDLGAKSGTIKQSFYTKTPFSSIEFQSTRTNNSDAKYAIVLSSKGKVLANRTALPEYVNNDTERMALTVGKQVPKGMQKYTVTIKPLSNKDSISFSYDSYKSMKRYRGNFYINGKKTKGNLFLRAYNFYYEPVMSTVAYWILVIIAMIIEAGAFITLIKLRKKE